MLPVRRMPLFPNSDMKRCRRITAWLLVLTVFLASGCLSARLPEETGTDGPPGAPAVSSESGTTVSPSETVPPEMLTPETELPTETDPPETLPPETKLPPGMTVFFGRPMDERIAAINRRTLETPGSGLFDVLSPRTFLNEEVLALIEAYTLPERPFYGARALTPELREQILANRNTAVFSGFPGAEAPLRYGIICENASVRSFPTSLRACDSLDGSAFDYLQESMFQIGEGVLILHESLDQEWAFVQGTNYAGWVLLSDIAFTSQEEFRTFLTGSDFAAVIRPSVPVRSTLSTGEPFQKTLRLGTVLPLKKYTDSAVTLVFPVKNEVGELQTEEITLENNGAFSAGFAPYSADALLKVARGVLGQPYGWGDEKGGYDCSSFVGLVYRCFGIYMPRNSSQQKYAGGSVTDVAGRETSWKFAFLEERPAAVLAYPGHVMLYEKTEGGRHYVLHANTAYYGTDGTRNDVYQVAEAKLEDLHRSDGTLLLDAVTVIVTYP